VVGAIIIIVLLVLVVPVAIIMSGLVASGVLGHLLKRDVDLSFEGHELLELSRQDFSAPADD
jgi:hypothetical protein